MVETATGACVESRRLCDLRDGPMCDDTDFFIDKWGNAHVSALLGCRAVVGRLRTVAFLNRRRAASFSGDRIALTRFILFKVPHFFPVAKEFGPGCRDDQSLHHEKMQ
jgi:hypothetical protein